MPEIDAPSFAPRDAPCWSDLSAGWPGAKSSQFWRVGRFVWHVQRAGAGPKVLFLHGTGAASHSWAPLVAEMNNAFETVCIDLPGHGFTQTPRGFRPSLPDMSKAVADLCQEMGFLPDIIVGHSAGAAIAIRLATKTQIKPRLLVSVNGALQPFEGMMKLIAPATAKLAVFGGIAARMVSRNSTSDARVRRLVKGVGSDPDQIDTSCYSALLRTPGHVQGALKMMAHWDLTGIMYDCGKLEMPAAFIVGDLDRAVPPSVSKEAAGLVPNGVYIELSKLGHLAHEEAPKQVERAIVSEWAKIAS